MSYKDPTERRHSRRQRYDALREAAEVEQKRKHDEVGAPAKNIIEHLRLLRDRQIEPDVSVEKVRPITWLGSLFVPDAQLIRSWEGRYKLSEVVGGWTVHNACLASDIVKSQDVIITEDGLITIADRYIRDDNPSEGTVSVIEYALKPVEEQIYSRVLTKWDGLATIDWPHIEDYLGSLVTEIDPVDS